MKNKYIKTVANRGLLSMKDFFAKPCFLRKLKCQGHVNCLVHYNIYTWTGTWGNQVEALEPNMNSQGKLLERKLRRDGEERVACPVVCSLPSILPLLRLACLVNQTLWWVLVLWVPTPPPPAPEPSFSASFLFVWLKTWSF